MLTLIVAIMSVVPAWQDGVAQDSQSPAQSGAQSGAQASEEAAGTSPAPTAEGLRSKVHKLRMDLVLGGEQVQRAESEAVDFYSDRLELLDRRLDRIDVDLSEMRASYQLALGRTVDSPTGSSGAIREASRLRAEIAELEGEAAHLRGKRAQQAVLIDRIADRGRDREALAANLEANNVIDFDGGLQMSSIGFGPGDVGAPTGSPFDDPELVRELIALDPQRGRIALYSADPEGYWRFFTLQPPVEVLREVLVFPLPDLPGKR